MMSILLLTLLPVLMLLAAANDVATMEIPNWLNALIAVLFLPFAWATGMSLVDTGWHLLAGLVLFFIGYVLFALRLFGGGDAKLMAAAGLWFGTSDVFAFLYNTAVAGGCLALAYVVWTAYVARKHADPDIGFRQRLRAMAPKLPYGCALAAGAILAFPATWWAETATKMAGHAA
jgi:prepilin peptidase CpaA